MKKNLLKIIAIWMLLCSVLLCSCRNSQNDFNNITESSDNQSDTMQQVVDPKNETRYELNSYDEIQALFTPTIRDDTVLTQRIVEEKYQWEFAAAHPASLALFAENQEIARDTYSTERYEKGFQ